MTPPETILDRWVKNQSREHPQFGGYLGKLDLETVGRFGPFLIFVEDAMNAALKLESANASGGVQHPPYHFDYLQVKDETKNAHAFQHEGFSFIVVTLPLVQLLWDLSVSLSSSETVQRLLPVNPETTRRHALQALLFQFHLTFLVSHEYTHHVHQHCNREGIVEVWTEFFKADAIGGLNSQAQELDADGYAIYLVLANFIRGEGRKGALLQLECQGLPIGEADALLFTCFFMALTALFCSLWPENIQTDSIYELKHPPAPVRIEYAIRVAEMWCTQNGSLPKSWFSAERVNALLRASTESVRGSTPQSWDAHVEFLQSTAGADYNRLLSEQFEAIRKGPKESPTALANA